MTLPVLVDVNLSPSWVDWLQRHGCQAVHWSAVGDPRAKARVVLQWASDRGHVLFTHDLDFGAILASSNLRSPSVVQLRAQDVTPRAVGPLLLEALSSCEAELRQGALISVDETSRRVRVLPLETSPRSKP
jgi:predicted nuclease of predicted toxin-antitoxin system